MLVFNTLHAENMQFAAAAVVVAAYINFVNSALGGDGKRVFLHGAVPHRTHERHLSRPAEKEHGAVSAAGRKGEREKEGPPRKRERGGGSDTTNGKNEAVTLRGGGVTQTRGV
jgi:hypothetical protein